MLFGVRPRFLGGSGLAENVTVSEVTRVGQRSFTEDTEVCPFFVFNRDVKSKQTLRFKTRRQRKLRGTLLIDKGPDSRGVSGSAQGASEEKKAGKTQSRRKQVGEGVHPEFLRIFPSLTPPGSKFSAPSSRPRHYPLSFRSLGTQPLKILYVRSFLNLKIRRGGKEVRRGFGDPGFTPEEWRGTGLGSYRGRCQSQEFRKEVCRRSPSKISLSDY